VVVDVVPAAAVPVNKAAVAAVSSKV